MTCIFYLFLLNLKYFYLYNVLFEVHDLWVTRTYLQGRDRKKTFPFIAFEYILYKLKIKNNSGF